MGGLWSQHASTIAVRSPVLNIAGFAHLDELDVLPSAAVVRVSESALLAAGVAPWANTAGYPAVTLRTFRDVPWSSTVLPSAWISGCGKRRVVS